MSSFLPLLYCKCKSQFESYTTHCHILNTTIYMYKKGWTQRGCLRRGGHWKPKAWTDGASSDEGRVWGEVWSPLSLKSLSLRMHFKPFGNPFSIFYNLYVKLSCILKHLVPNYYFCISLSSSFYFGKVPMLVERWQINCNASFSQPNVQKNSRAHVRGGLKIWKKKMLEKNNQAPHKKAFGHRLPYILYFFIHPNPITQALSGSSLGLLFNFPESGWGRVGGTAFTCELCDY